MSSCSGSECKELLASLGGREVAHALDDPALAVAHALTVRNLRGWPAIRTKATGDNGVPIEILDATTLHIGGAKKLISSDMTTEEYPGFATDMQAQYMALATQAEGTSTITETIFENRFLHASEMLRMGANIKLREKLRYTHANPVARGLVRHPGDWPWSSWGFYEKGEAGLVTIDAV